MSQYLFAVVFSGGAETEVEQVAATEREARAAAWNSLTDAQRDAVESIECVDEITLPA